jgi:hypothetical protein
MQQQLASIKTKQPSAWAAHRVSCLHPHRRRASKHHAAAVAGRQADSPFGVVIEVDGVLADLHSEGHRAAFNK